MKGKFLGVAIILATSSSAWSQDYKIKRDTVVKQNEDKYRVVTNRFLDNWFIGGGIGAQMYFGDHNKQMKFSERLSPAYEFYFGKWFSPAIGVRAAVNGLKALGVTQNHSYSTGEVYDASKWLEKQEIKYFNVHADVLFNMSNILSGYRDNRFYNVSPYVGLGWMATTKGPGEQELSANIGVFNSFRLSNAIDLTFDVRGSMVNDRFDGEIGKRSGEGLLTSAVGIAYKFKKRNWEKPKTVVISYDEAEIASLYKRVKSLAQDNDYLRKQLSTAKSATITDIKMERKMLAAPILITFEINKSVVSNETRVNLGFFAKVIRESDQAVVYSLKGYADKGTGSDATNERLSRERADAIYNILVREFGVSASQLKVSYEGSVKNMFYDDPRLSRAVIAIAE